MEGQTVVLDLADELGIEHEAAAWRDDLISARGFFGWSSDELNAAAYPLVDDATTEGALYDELLSRPLRARAGKFPDSRAYVRAAVGVQGYQFLADMFRLRAALEYPISSTGFLEIIDEDANYCCTPSYPIGGMSQFIPGSVARQGGHRDAVVAAGVVARVAPAA
jgi:hypothetical protein